jgi:hypothetical protein
MQCVCVDSKKYMLTNAQCTFHLKRRRRHGGGAGNFPRQSRSNGGRRGYCGNQGGRGNFPAWVAGTGYFSRDGDGAGGPVARHNNAPWRLRFRA